MTSQWNLTRMPTQNIWCVAHSMYCRVRKYIFTRNFLNQSAKRFTPNFRTGNVVFVKEVWQWNEFKRLCVFSSTRLKCEVNLFVRDFSDVFYLASLLHLFSQKKVFKRDFWEASVLNKCFQLLGIKFKVSLYIGILLWVPEGNPGFSSNVLEEKRPCCRKLKGL